MQFDITTQLHRKSGFGLHQLRNRCSPEADHREEAAYNDAKYANYSCYFRLPQRPHARWSGSFCS